MSVLSSSRSSSSEPDSTGGRPVSGSVGERVVAAGPKDEVSMYRADRVISEALGRRRELIQRIGLLNESARGCRLKVTTSNVYQGSIGRIDVLPGGL